MGGSVILVLINFTLVLITVVFICRRILKCNPPIPKDFSPQVKDLIQKLLIKDPVRRLGSRGAEEVKKHPFFKVSSARVHGYL